MSYPLVRRTASSGYDLPQGGFCNVDLEVRGTCDLSPLLAALESKLFVLHATMGTRRSFIRVELPADARSADDAIVRLAKLVLALRGKPRSLWLKCDHRVLDIGYQAGTAEGPLVDVIGPTAIGLAHRIGAAIAITVYRAADAPDAKPGASKRATKARTSAKRPKGQASR